MSLHSSPLPCYCCGRLVDSFPRKATRLYLPFHLPAVLPQDFQLFFSRDPVLLWRALLTRLRCFLAPGPFTSLSLLAKYNLSLLWWIGWLIDLLIAEKAASAFPPPLPLLCLRASEQSDPYHQDMGCGQPWCLSPSAHRLLICLSSKFPCPEWPQAPRCSLDSVHDSPQNQQLCHSTLRDLSLSQSLYFLCQVVIIIPASQAYCEDKIG